MGKPRYPYQDGLFVDDDGRRWQREDDFLEPADVDDLLAREVPALVEWCGGGTMPRPVPIRGEELATAILPALLDRRSAAKKIRRQRVPTVFVPELWRHGRDTLIIFVEGAPAGRWPPRTSGGSSLGEAGETAR